MFTINMSSQIFRLYLKPWQLFCNIGVSQYSQEITCARASFFINSLQLQAIPIKKRRSGTGIFLTIEISKT